MSYPEISWETLRPDYPGLKHPPFKSTKHIICAISGGADSLLAADLTFHIRKAYTPMFQFDLVYFEHESPIEPRKKVLEQFYAHIVNQHKNTRFMVKTLPVSQVATSLKTSWEHAGSLLRKKHLARLAKKNKAIVILGHHLNDWYELVTMRTEKTSSADQLRPHRITERVENTRFCRPLAFLTKKDVVHLASKRGLSWWEDPSNYNGSNQRSKLRNQGRELDTGSLKEKAMIAIKVFYNDTRLLHRKLLKAKTTGAFKHTEKQYFIKKAWFQGLPRSEQARLKWLLGKRFCLEKDLLSLPMPDNKQVQNWKSLEIWLENYGSEMWYCFCSKNQKPPGLDEKHETWGNSKIRTIQLAYGRKQLKKIFSELRLSERQRNHLPINLNSHRELNLLKLSVYGIKDIGSS